MSKRPAEHEKRILLIEDDISFTSIILSYLSEAQTMRLDSASTLAAGAEFIRRETYDAILLNLTLPDSRGLGTLKTVRDFAAVLAHDLKTPVIGTDRLLGILLNDSQGPLTDSQREILILLKQGCEQSLQKIQNVLEVFRFDLTKTELQLVPTDLAPIILDCTKQQEESTAAAANGLHFSVNVPPSLPGVLVDDGAVRKVLCNILDNAVKFSPPEGTISITALGTEDSATVVVQDQGPGIAKEYQRNLFDRFWQGGPQTHYTATTGLGLYLCNQIVTAHGGTITCVSDSGEGTQFSITLKKRSDLKHPTLEHKT